MEHIADLENYIRSRQQKGKTAMEILQDLRRHGYDEHAARALVMLHWKYKEQ